MKKKKILLLSDDLRMSSGVGTVSKEFVIGTIHKYDWVQIAGAVKHPDSGKAFDMNDSIEKEFGIKDAYLKLYPISGYGNSEFLRQILKVEKPDAIIIYTDPRFWGWFFHMEAELRQKYPILYYSIWDDLPYPMWNEKFYESVDCLMNISKQTYNIVKSVRQFNPVKDWQCTYLPHGINENNFYKITSLHKDWSKYQEFRTKIFKNSEIDFVLFYNNRNIRRKLTSDAIIAFKTFCDTLPKEKADKCVFVLHTQPKDSHGTDLPDVVNKLCPDYKVYFSHQKLDIQHLNYLYNIADVTINIASNEGFGLGTVESLMAGTPIIVNVTGGLVDQMRFEDESGEMIEYTIEFPSNHNGRYKKHGDWGLVVFPKTRSIQGSITTPYIFDDRPDFEDVAHQIKKMYDFGDDVRQEMGERGHKWVISDESMMSARLMCKNFIRDIENTFKNWKPKKRYNLYNVTTYKRKLPKHSGILLKEN